MDELPVTIRLLGPPLNEFLPDRTEMTAQVAVADTLPGSNMRCIHTYWTLSSMQSRAVASVVSGRVPMTTASTPSGRDLRS